MKPAVKVILAIAKTKEAIDDFDRGDVNATETLKRIIDACKAAEPPAARRDAA